MESAEGIIDNLLYLSPDRKLLYVTDTTDGKQSGTLEHLSCFLGGLLALGAATIPDVPPRHLWAAEGLTHTCWLTYADQPTGLGPDEVAFHPNTADGTDAYEVFQNGTHRWVNALARWEAAGAVGAPPGTGQALPVTDRLKMEYTLRRTDYLLRCAPPAEDRGAGC
jgi:hypothetical protein